MAESNFSYNDCTKAPQDGTVYHKENIHQEQQLLFFFVSIHYFNAHTHYSSHS